ncbi:hypothetical protein KCU85_g136, partial [Aureobasidium melanogenum]
MPCNRPTISSTPVCIRLHQRDPGSEPVLFECASLLVVWCSHVIKTTYQDWQSTQKWTKNIALILSASTHSSLPCSPSPAGPKTKEGIPASLSNAASVQNFAAVGRTSFSPRTSAIALVHLWQLKLELLVCSSKSIKDCGTQESECRSQHIIIGQCFSIHFNSFQEIGSRHDGIYACLSIGAMCSNPENAVEISSTHAFVFLICHCGENDIALTAMRGEIQKCGHGSGDPSLHIQYTSAVDLAVHKTAAQGIHASPQDRDIVVTDVERYVLPGRKHRMVRRSHDGDACPVLQRESQNQIPWCSDRHSREDVASPATSEACKHAAVSGSTATVMKCDDGCWVCIQLLQLLFHFAVSCTSILFLVVAAAEAALETASSNQTQEVRMQIMRQINGRLDT